MNKRPMTPEQEADLYASILEKIAYRVRSGELKVTGFTQEREWERYYVGEEAHAFGIGDIKTVISYHNPEHQMQERNKRTTFLMNHPDAEKA